MRSTLTHFGRSTPVILAMAVGALAPRAFSEEAKVIARAGVDVKLEDGWRGVISEIANDPSRTVAWTSHASPFFGLTRSFALAPERAADVERILSRISEIHQLHHARIVLSPEAQVNPPKEVSSEKAGNVAAVFMIGGEKSPRLMLSAGHPLCDLERIKLPEGVAIEAAYDEAYLKAHPNDPILKKIESAVSKYRKKAGDKARVRLVVELARYCNAMEPFDPDADDSRWDRERDSVSGFAFKVIEPAEFAGQYLLSHHDGWLASGHPDNYAVKGRQYALRTERSWIGRKGGGICSVDLDIEPLPHPTTRPATRTSRD